MGNVLIVFSSKLAEDLAERPGRSKLDKENAAKPRVALAAILRRLSRDMEAEGGTSHLRADLFEEPISTLRIYEPGSLADLLVNFGELVTPPREKRLQESAA